MLMSSIHQHVHQTIVLKLTSKQSLLGRQNDLNIFVVDLTQRVETLQDLHKSATSKDSKCRKPIFFWRPFFATQLGLKCFKMFGILGVIQEKSWKVWDDTTTSHQIGKSLRSLVLCHSFATFWMRVFFLPFYLTATITLAFSKRRVSPNI